MFEDLLTTLFPLYLMSRVACRAVFPEIMVTHGERNEIAAMTMPDYFTFPHIHSRQMKEADDVLRRYASITSNV